MTTTQQIAAIMALRAREDCILYGEPNDTVMRGLVPSLTKPAPQIGPPSRQVRRQMKRQAKKETRNGL